MQQLFSYDFFALKSSGWYTNVWISKDSKVPHSTTNISDIERNFSQCMPICQFVFSSSEKETLFSKEVVNESDNNLPWFSIDSKVSYSTTI